MVESLHWFTVDVGHQVSLSQTSVEGRRALVHLHHQVVDLEEVCVTKVDSDVLEVETEASWTSSDDDRRFESGDQGRHISTRTGVSAGGGAGASWTLQRLDEILVHVAGQVRLGGGGLG